MSIPKLKIITTGDGSHSLLREDINETYHSFHGAKGESAYVFIQTGLDYYLFENAIQRVKILEVGFGTGLNAFLTALYASTKKQNVIFHSLEPIPVPEAIFTKLNYGANPEESKLLQQIHECAWETSCQINAFFQLTKMKTTLEELVEMTDYDIIYFDAFAPSRQPDIWQFENIQKCFTLLKKGGILTTYCAQGQFKRNIKEAGFELEILKGAMGKKEMVRARKP